jgi:signal transduction histidine kinase
VEALKEALRGIHEGTSETVRRYAGLAATGQLATLVVSRLEHPLDQLGSEVKLLAVELKTSDTLLASRDAIEAISERMERRLGELRRILARLDPLARPRGGRRLLPVQLEDCVSDVAAIYSDKIGRAQIDFQLVPDGRQSVLSDLCVTEQVLAILFDNAVYWLSKVKPPRTLRATLRGKSLILENNGPAIEKAHASLIFDPHFTTREDASGMGLALARDLLESVGGKLVLKPRRRGATFELSFSR